MAAARRAKKEEMRSRRSERHERIMIEAAMKYNRIIGEVNINLTAAYRRSWRGLRRGASVIAMKESPMRQL